MRETDTRFAIFWVWDSFCAGTILVYSEHCVSPPQAFVSDIKKRAAREVPIKGM